MKRGIDFPEVHEAFKRDIKVSALSQRVPGLDYDDIVSEMTICLWKAHQTFKARTGTSFAAYWWSLWLNRRSDIAEAYYATRRTHPVLTDEPLDQAVMDPRPLPEAPAGCSDADRMVWDLLAEGDTARQVMDTVGVSRRRYYATIKGWQNDEVRAALSAD